MAVLLREEGEESFSLKNMKAAWISMFCFSFHGGTIATLWPIDFDFDFAGEFSMSVMPDIPKRRGTDCTENPGALP